VAVGGGKNKQGELVNPRRTRKRMSVKPMATFSSYPHSRDCVSADRYRHHWRDHIALLQSHRSEHCPANSGLSANYPGADARLSSSPVATPIEQQFTASTYGIHGFRKHDNGSANFLLVRLLDLRRSNMDLILTQSRQQRTSASSRGDQLRDHVAKVGHRSFPAGGLVLATHPRRGFSG